MGMFDEIEIEKDLVEVEDKIGGFKKFDKTGFYTGVIEKAYAKVSDGGAFGVVTHIKRADGAVLQNTEWITSGTAKGCKNYWIDKNDNKNPLPGYTNIHNLDGILGYDRDYPKTEKGNIMLYDFDLKTEVPTEVEIISEWVGKEIGLLGMVLIEDKWNEKTKSVTKFEVKHFVDAKTGKTRNEQISGKDGFKAKWVKAYGEDYVVDKREESKGASVDSAGATKSDDDSPF